MSRGAVSRHSSRSNTKGPAASPLDKFVATIRRRISVRRAFLYVSLILVALEITLRIGGTPEFAEEKPELVAKITNYAADTKYETLVIGTSMADAAIDPEQFPHLNMFNGAVGGVGYQNFTRLASVYTRQKRPRRILLVLPADIVTANPLQAALDTDSQIVQDRRESWYEEASDAVESAGFPSALESLARRHSVLLGLGVSISRWVLDQSSSNGGGANLRVLTPRRDGMALDFLQPGGETVRSQISAPEPDRRSGRMWEAIVRRFDSSTDIPIALAIIPSNARDTSTRSAAADQATQIQHFAMSIGVPAFDASDSMLSISPTSGWHDFAHPSKLGANTISTALASEISLHCSRFPRADWCEG